MMLDLIQDRHGQFLAGKAASVAATSAAALYSEKSRQGLDLGGLASRGGPVTYIYVSVLGHFKFKIRFDYKI
jgi:hypothetical protein